MHDRLEQRLSEGTAVTNYRIWVRLIDHAEIEQMAEWLKSNGAKEVRQTQYQAIDPTQFPVIVTTVIAGIGGLTAFLGWIRRQRRCLLIVDARGEEVKVSFDCRERQGRSIIVASEGVVVEVMEGAELLDLGAIAVAAAQAGASKAVEMVLAAGGNACVIEVPDA
jgi:hypothetical protein